MSVSSVSLSSDANVRYQRLAQEYTKLRAQAKVLREGVLEERGRGDKLAVSFGMKNAPKVRQRSFYKKKKPIFLEKTWKNSQFLTQERSKGTPDTPEIISAE